MSYTASDGWGGVVWQNPANNWGDKPGGWNLTGAKKLSFWARGDKGGEKVTFLFGLVGKDKPTADSGYGQAGRRDADEAVEAVHHRPERARTSPTSRPALPGRWARTAHRITFYLDDVKYQ